MTRLRLSRIFPAPVRSFGGWRLAFCAAIALAGAGCTQTAKNDLATTSTGAAGEPLVLNSAPATGTSTAVNSAAKSDKALAKTAAPPPETAATAAPPQEPAPASPLPATAAGTEPLPLGTAPTAEAPPAAAKSADAFPNINVTPAEPEGKLLSAEERKKIIGELEALRTRQKPAPGEKGGGAKAAALAKEGQTHGPQAIKKIQKCSNPDTAADDPDCQPAAEEPADADASAEKLPAD